MKFIQGLQLYFILLGSFLLLDGIWLGLIARNLYRTHLGHLMAESVSWLPALLFYALFVTGILIFVVLPAVESGSLLRAIGYGFLFGLVCYATYDLTNQATLEGWPVNITIIDLVWGGVISLVVSAVGYVVARLLW